MLTETSSRTEFMAHSIQNRMFAVQASHTGTCPQSHAVHIVPWRFPSFYPQLRGAGETPSHDKGEHAQ